MVVKRNFAWTKDDRISISVLVMAATDIWLIALSSSPSARVRSRQLKKRFYGRGVSAEGPPGHSS